MRETLLQSMPLLSAATLIFFGSALCPGQDGTKELKNIAKGKSYEWSLPPNYQYCSHDPEKKQLTDGVYAKPNKVFWLQNETVGWSHRIPHITVDLGKDMPVTGASFSTAGGRAGVTFPKHIFIMASTDGRNFYYAGDLAAKAQGSLPKDGAGEKTFIYRSDDIKTHGRYIRFFPCLGAGPFVFVDELEIYEGEPGLMSAPYRGKAFTGNEPPTDLMVDASARIRCEKDLQAIREQLEKAAIPMEKKMRIKSDLDEVARQLAETPMNFNSKTFRAVVPFNDIHRKIFAQHAKILAAEGYRPLTVWPAYRYSPLSLLEKPVAAAPNLSIRMMRNEYRAEVFNITNAGPEAVKVSFALKGVPDCVEVRQVEYVDTSTMQVASVALTKVPYANGRYETLVNSGMTRQIWMTFHPVNTKGGTYSGSVAIKADGFSENIPLKLEISEFAWEKPGLKVAAYDYAANLIQGITVKNRTAVIDDLRSHLVNVAVGHGKQAAVPKVGDVDKNGHLIKPLNFGPFEEWLKIWPDAEKYQMFLAVRPETRFAGLKPGTPEFNTAVKEWTASWNAYLKKANIPAKKVQFFFFDEPRTPENYEVLRLWLIPFNEVNTMIEMFNDPVSLDEGRNMETAVPALELCDVICPMLDQYIRYDKKITGFLAEQARKGKSLWFYSCYGPNRFYDPSYFRFQPWYCFKYGMTGSIIWVYSDYPDNWNEYAVTGGLSYSMVYLSPDSTTPTKLWEAFREGVQDYGYLAMLRNQLGTASPEKRKKAALVLGSGVNPDKIMETLLEQVMKGKFFEAGRDNLSWRKETPCVSADRARFLILDILKILQEDNAPAVSK